MDRFLETTLKILDGAVDYHLHVAPDPQSERITDGYEAARQARTLKMKALGIKCHAYPTGPIADLIMTKYPEIDIIGTIVLNREIGGINPYAVESAIKLHTKKICMPTTWSITARKDKGYHDGVNIFTDKGDILNSLKDILRLAKENDLIIETGHLVENEIMPLFKEAKQIGLKKFVVTHASKTEGRMLNLDIQAQLASQGAVIEHCFGHIFPFLGNIGVDRIVECIRHVGVEKCILSTDLGQVFNPSPWEGMKMAITTMLKCGFSEDEISTLVKTNPRRMFKI